MEYLAIQINLREAPQLMTQYAGAGPTMLLNLRFNVLAQISPKRDYLVWTLKPRSTSGVVRVSRMKEISFLLSGVIVKSFNTVTSVELVAYGWTKDQDWYEYSLKCESVPIEVASWQPTAVAI